ncbi:MAG: PIN domain-containing protein [Verrucomicrobiaceae bacterium]|nr:MAG: PIN domain-containing protein [Verrucomicrobiaceae bacterium]
MTCLDTSFLCALYVAQSTSARALQFMSRQRTALAGNSLLFYEFRQSVQFQVFRHSKDRSQGYSAVTAQVSLATLQANIAANVFQIPQVDWADAHRIAERLALQYTAKWGHRSFDVLHVAIALHLGAVEFLTFDANQRKLAEAEGLVVPL